MARYKVSYKVLSEQGTALKNVGKQIDSYASRINAVTGKLGNDRLLQTARTNLKKLSQQLEENRTVVNMAADVVTKCLEGYSGVEKKNVKRVDSAKAHNRDFYKNPVVVASAGGGAAAVAGGMGGGAGTGAAAAAAGPGGAASASTANVEATIETNVEVNAEFVDNSVTVNGDVMTGAGAVNGDSVVMPDFMEAPSGGGISGAAAAGIAAGAAAAGAGALYGGEKLLAYMKNKKKEKAAAEKQPETPAVHNAPADEDDPEVRLAQARARLAALNAKKDS